MIVYAVRQHWAYEFDDVVSLWTTVEKAQHIAKEMQEAETFDAIVYSVHPYEVYE